MASRHSDGNRQSIGDTHVESACNRLDDACKKEAALFVTQRFEREQILPWLFEADLLDKLRAINGVVNPAHSQMAYPIRGSASLTIIYEDYHENNSVPTIEPEYLRVQPEAEPLIAAIEIIEQIYIKWGAVKHMLRWFNKNATPGAIRNYWPAVLKLCPNVPAFQEMLDRAPTRFSAPKNIGAMLPLVRETASTVAGMALMPNDAAVHEGGTVRLTLSSSGELYCGHQIGLNALIFTL